MANQMYQEDSEEYARKMALAQALRVQSMSPIESQSVGGVPTPISPLQGIAKMFEGYQSGQMEKGATAERKQNSQKYTNDLAAALRGYSTDNDVNALVSSPHPVAQQLGTQIITKQNEPIHVKKGEQVYKGGKLAYEGAPDLPSGFVPGPGGQGMVADPNWLAAQEQIAKARRSQVNVNTPQEKEEAKTVGKGFGEQYNDLQKSALSAQSKLNRVERLDQLLEGVNTGKLTPAGAELSGYAQSLGFKTDPKLGNIQAAEALSNELALELRNPSGGAGMPGAMSDKDRDFLKAMTPGIEKTPEGRKLITESYRRLAQRDIEVAQLAREYRAKKGQLDEGFYEELRQYSAAKPVFQSPETKGPASTANPAIDDLLKKYGTAR